MLQSKIRGFSLIELMVGVTIGMLIILVTTNLLIGFTAQKGNISEGSSAQSAGIISAYMLSRSIASAGFGLPLNYEDKSPLKCPSNVVVNSDNDSSTPDADLFPVSIRSGDLSDTVSVRFSAAFRPSSFVTVNGGDVLAPVVSSTEFCAPGDTYLLALFSDTVSCSAGTVTGVNQATSSLSLQPAAAQSDNPVSDPEGALISCIPQWTSHVYSVDDSLQLIDQVSGLGANGQSISRTDVISSDVVAFRAKYGVSDEPSSNIVTKWVYAKGEWANPAPTLRQRIKSVKFYVTVRSTQFSKTSVSSECSNSAVPASLCGWKASDPSELDNIDLSHIPNWSQYHYKQYEESIPLPNLMWSKNALI